MLELDRRCFLRLSGCALLAAAAPRRVSPAGAREVDVPGGIDLLRRALGRAPGCSLEQARPLAPTAGARSFALPGAVRLDLASHGETLTVALFTGDGVLEVCGRPGQARRVARRGACPEPSAGAGCAAPDLAVVRDGEIWLLDSTALGLRHRGAERHPGARLPAAYDELLRRVSNHFFPIRPPHQGEVIELGPK